LNCPICRADEYWPLQPAEEPTVDALRNEAGETGPHDWRLCKICGNAYPIEQPKEAILDRYWQLNRRIDIRPEAEAAVWRQRVVMSRVGAERSYRTFAPLHRGAPGRLLDIACGLGETVALFRDHGWRAEGIDLDGNTKRFHAERGIVVRIGQLEDKAPDKLFDFIHIAHAIYFMRQPMAFMRRVRAQLAEGGLFGVVISDFLATSAQGQIPSYVHTFFPCRESMCYALALAGFEPILARRIGGSIYIAARADNVDPPRIDTNRIHRRYQTSKLRYAVFGRPYVAARQFAKRLLTKG
jgi:SAM-dependent methyltransferase